MNPKNHSLPAIFLQLNGDGDDLNDVYFSAIRHCSKYVCVTFKRLKRMTLPLTVVKTKTNVCTRVNVDLI